MDWEHLGFGLKRETNGPEQERTILIPSPALGSAVTRPRGLV